MDRTIYNSFQKPVRVLDKNPKFFDYCFTHIPVTVLVYQKLIIAEWSKWKLTGLINQML